MDVKKEIGAGESVPTNLKQTLCVPKLKVNYHFTQASVCLQYKCVRVQVTLYVFGSSVADTLFDLSPAPSTHWLD